MTEGLDRDAVLRLGTRGSALALAQASIVERALADAGGPPVERVIITTAGDRRAPDTAWGEGAFVAAIEDALLDGRVDAAVHSAKDIPTDETPGLRIAAFLAREDPRDALVVRAGTPATLASLPTGARVGTDSPRRTGFVRARRPDLHVHPLHGNVDTRLGRLDAGETDALVLAMAGLLRLGHGDRVGEPLEPEVLPPAPGQGAIAVQVRADDTTSSSWIRRIDDTATRACVEAERELLSVSGGGCRAPVGALGRVGADGMRLLAGWTAIDGSESTWADVAGDSLEGLDLARRAAARLEQGRARVLVTRAAGRAGDLSRAIRSAGLVPVHVPAIAIEPVGADGALDVALREARPWDRIVVTSANGARAIVAALGRVGSGPVAFASVGAATSRVLLEAGLPAPFEPSSPDGETLGLELPLERDARVLLVRGDLANDRLPTILSDRGAQVREVVGYRTRLAPDASIGPLRAAAGTTDAAPRAVVLASGSAVEGFLLLAERAGTGHLARLPALCLGRTAAAAARSNGMRIVHVEPSMDVEAGAAALAAALRSARPGNTA